MALPHILRAVLDAMSLITRLRGKVGPLVEFPAELTVPYSSTTDLVKGSDGSAGE